MDPVMVRPASTAEPAAHGAKARSDLLRAPLTDLHIWWSDDLFGQWRPHAANPVKIDARSARPAGTPFVHAGTLYRPAQDCSHTYGGAVAICRVRGWNAMLRAT